MWMRNLFFVAVLLGGNAALSAALFLSLVPRGSSMPTRISPCRRLPVTVARLNSTFRDEWQREKLVPAGPAEDLVIASPAVARPHRQHSFLQEVRQFESLPEQDRIARWVARPSSPTAAMRTTSPSGLARVYVGTKTGRSSSIAVVVSVPG